MMKSLIVAGAMLTGLSAGMAHADPVMDALTALKIDAIACRFHDTELEQADRDRAVKALTAMQGQDLAAVDAMMPDLHAALARAPDAPAKPELCGDSLEIYSDDLNDLLKTNALLAGDPAVGNLKGVLKGAMPYGSLGFIIGWIEYEHADYVSAERDLRQRPAECAGRSQPGRPVCPDPVQAQPAAGRAGLG